MTLSILFNLGLWNYLSVKSIKEVASTLHTIWGVLCWMNERYALSLHAKSIILFSEGEGEVENEAHFMLECSPYNSIREWWGSFCVLFHTMVVILL